MTAKELTDHIQALADQLADELGAIKIEVQMHIYYNPAKVGYIAQKDSPMTIKELVTQLQAQAKQLGSDEIEVTINRYYGPFKVEQIDQKVNIET